MTRQTVLTLTPNPALDVWTTTPEIQPGPKLRCTVPDIDPGGGGINVSRVLHRHGVATRALFPAGGPTGKALAEVLSCEGVPELLVPTAATTRQSFSVRETDTGDVLRFVTPGPELTAAECAVLLDRLAEHAADAALVVGSGSLPGGTVADFWAEAARRTRAAGSRFVLDTHDGAGPALAEGVFCLRENTDAIAAIAGRDLAWPMAAAEWADEQVRTGRAEMVVVTEGGAGALMVADGLRIVVHPPEVKPVSAIGAGDSFVAGLCLGLLRGDTPGDTLRRAVATATATLLSTGTDLCQPAEVERLLARTGAAEAV
jgi:6-phosphofructokinase 2